MTDTTTESNTGGADATATTTATTTAEETQTTTQETPATDASQQQPSPDQPKQESPQEEQKTPPSVKDAYKVDTEGSEEEQPENTEQKPDSEEEQPYAIEWPEGYEATPEFEAVAVEAAKGSGLDGKAAGLYTSRVLDALNEVEIKNMERTDAELKEEWGGDYNARMKECKSFLSRHAKQSGLTNEDIAVLQSPKGFRLIYSFMQATGESPAHMGKADASTKSWAHEAMNNPSHPDYKALHELNDPRHDEVTRRWYRAQGASGI